jgi:hypothetical protein
MGDRPIWVMILGGALLVFGALAPLFIEVTMIHFPKVRDSSPVEFGPTSQPTTTPTTEP